MPETKQCSPVMARISRMVSMVSSDEVDVSKKDGQHGAVPSIEGVINLLGQAHGGWTGLKSCHTTVRSPHGARLQSFPSAK